MDQWIPHHFYPPTQQAVLPVVCWDCGPPLQSPSGGGGGGGGGGGAPGVKANGAGCGQATGASVAPASSAAAPSKPQQQQPQQSQSQPQPQQQHHHQQQQQQQDPKPVECNLCHRKFKNIPALNGHMRLHGGYFKKDSEAKKCEKKEVSGPPLQTASMSVRALIEEKIIQKRITNPSPVASSSQAHSTQHISFTTSGAMNGVRAPGLGTYATSSSSPGLAGKDPPDLNIKLSSFVVPAPPPQVALAAVEKMRRHSESEHFVSPRAPAHASAVDHEAAALAELLLKRSALAVKRASSDPGHHSSNSSASPSPQPTQQLHLSFQGGETYALSYQGEDGGYFSPSLQEDMFQQSVQETMLLHGVDTAQLAESIQLQAASLLQDQAAAEHLQDIASLEDYQSATVNSPGVAQYQSQNSHGISQDFQAVLSSPLPVSLADFSPYGQQSPIPKDLSYQPSPSPLQQKEFVSYANSPHTMLGTNSPLPSPLAHHDSPSFTYPTPPASQEGQSPSFSHGGLVTSGIPLSSPQQNTTDSYVQSVISHGGHVPPVSSPLSAAFYTTTMSSSAAVEEALSEVLPVESLSGQGCMRSHGLGLYQTLVNPSPPPQSPLSATPVPSPLSLSSVPASSSSVSSPLPSASFTPTQGQVSYPLSPHHTLQSHMMPNSEDPLLSSSPKDFASRKKFDFGGIHSFKLVGNGMVDFGMSNTGLTGIMVDSNGELKFFQAANPSQSKGIVMPNSNSMNGSAGNMGMFQKKEDPSRARLLGKVSTHHSSHYYHTTSFSSRSQRPKLQVAVDNIKEEVDDDVFLSPTSIPASPIRVARKRSRPEPLYLPPQPHPSYQSRLRCTRAKDSTNSSSSYLPYTPAPMLSPSRQGQGLYWQAAASPAPAAWPSSTTTSQNGSAESPSPDESQQGNDSAPESDSNPHINVGSEYQCAIPKWNPDREKANREPSYEHLLWDPGISKVCTDAEVDMYLEFACCAAVPGGGRNKEYALHLLHMCHGNIHEAMLKLMQPTPALPVTHPLLAYDYCESDRWSADEMDVFHQGLLKYDKDFTSIAHEIGSKTTKQCIQFYYLWKKVCPEEYKRLRLIRRRQNADFSSRIDLDFEDIKLDESRNSIPASDVELVTTSSESRLFVCEYSDCSASFNSRAALNGHIRIHSGSVCGRSPTPDKRPSTATPPMVNDILEEFPCKICGKVFSKVKSRSAHMKSHRPPDAEPKKPKLDPHKMESAEQTLGRTMGVSSSVSASSGRHT